MAKKARGKVKAKAKRKPVKAGRSEPMNIGGILNVKVVATAKKLKNGQGNN